jgi:hypothetical protein
MLDGKTWRYSVKKQQGAGRRVEIVSLLSQQKHDDIRRSRLWLKNRDIFLLSGL